MVSSTNRLSGRKIAAVAVSCVALAGATLGSALAARNQPGSAAAGTATGWASLARHSMLLAETAGADADELDVLNGWLEDDGASGEVDAPEPDESEAPESEAPEASEAPEKSEAPDRPEAPKATHETNDDDQGEDADDQGENEQEGDSGEHDDAGSDSHDSGEHDGGDSGEGGD